MILLDTCTLLWLARGAGLPASVADQIADENNAVFVSAVSAWEIGIKLQKRKLALPMPLAEWWEAVLEQHALAEVPIDGAIAARSTILPRIHADPADRILIATSMHLRATLLTPDPLIREYPDVSVRWESRS